MNIIVNGIKECSGTCPFCTLCSTTGTKHSIDDIKAIDDRTYASAKWDFEALENALIQSPYWTNVNSILIWGGDPLTSFKCTCEVVDFIEYLEKKYDKHIYKVLSTNGLALKRDDVVEYILKHGIAMQLSHDGTANHLRVKEDPLTFGSTIELMKHGNINTVYCVQSKFNSNIYEQMEIFDPLPVKTRRISPVRMTNDGYTIEDPVYFKQLTEILLKYDPNDPNNKYVWQPLIRQFTTSRDTACSRYHKGKSPYTTMFDTLGKPTECHLLDSSQHVQAKDIEYNKPPKCKDCPFSKTFACNGCGLVPLKDGTEMKECFYFKVHIAIKMASLLNPKLQKLIEFEKRKF